MTVMKESVDDDDDDDLDKRIRPREACIAVRLMVQNRTSSWRLMFIFHCMTIGMLYLLKRLQRPYRMCHRTYRGFLQCFFLSAWTYSVASILRVFYFLGHVSLRRLPSSIALLGFGKRTAG